MMRNQKLMIGFESFSKQSVDVWPIFGFIPVLKSTVLLKYATLQYFLWLFLLGLFGHW